MVQYDALSDKYVRLKDLDPAKQFVQYPSAMKFLGSVKGKRILYVGCGDGEFARRLARRGAKVAGYDHSSVQLQKAKKAERDDPLGVAYFLSDPFSFTSSIAFDKAVSIMTLPHARDKEELGAFFSSTSKILKEKGVFVSIIFNPAFRRVKDIVCYRRWTRLKAGKIKVEFYERGVVPFFVLSLSDFMKEDYVECAKKGGFKEIVFKQIIISKLGLARQGALFWKGFLADPPYIAFIAKK